MVASHRLVTAVDVLADAGGRRARSTSGTSTSCPKTRTCSSRCWLHLGRARQGPRRSSCPSMPTRPKARRCGARRREPVPADSALGVGRLGHPVSGAAQRCGRAHPVAHARRAVGWYVEEHLVWPSHWFLLTLGGLVPPLINPAYAHSALGLWQTSLFSTLLGLCLPSLVLAILADWLLQVAHATANGPGRRRRRLGGVRAAAGDRVWCWSPCRRWTRTRGCCSGARWRIRSPRRCRQPRSIVASTRVGAARSRRRRWRSGAARARAWPGRSAGS